MVEVVPEFTLLFGQSYVLVVLVMRGGVIYFDSNFSVLIDSYRVMTGWTTFSGVIYCTCHRASNVQLDIANEKGLICYTNVTFLKRAFQ